MSTETSAELPASSSDSRVLMVLQWSSPEGDDPHALVCTQRDVLRFLGAFAIALVLFGVAGATWTDHRQRMASLSLEEAQRENRLLRERQAELFDRVFDLVTRFDAEGARLGMSERQTVRTEAEKACLAAQYILDTTPTEPAALSAEDLAPRIRLHCEGLAQGTRRITSENLRAAM
jgi:hypothetical protein